MACETLVTTGMAICVGEVTTTCYAPIAEIVRDTVKRIGYVDASWGFDANTCAVISSIDKQSPDIAMGVNTGGAGDQGMMFGYASDETDELMPLPITLAHRLTKRLAEARKSGEIAWLRPDGKSQVTVVYENHRPVAVDTVVISTQHADHVSNAEIHETIRDLVILPTIPENLRDGKLTLHINPTGRFVLGGPHGDAGLTGRKIIVDTYGGMGRHGGGAFSGKDPSKVDRSACYAARWVAKNVVAAGLAKRCEVQVAYAIGVAEPVSITVDTFGTATVPEPEIMRVIRDVFDLRPLAIIAALDLRKPIYRDTAAYGHFGRPQFSWERTNRVADLQTALSSSKHNAKREVAHASR